MARAFMIAAAVALLMLSSTGFAQQPSQFGNADEAKAMLAKAVAAMKADTPKALDMFNRGEGGFLDRDLYPFCFNISDGKHLATQAKHYSARILGYLKTPPARRLPGTLRRGAEAGRSNHRGHLHVSKAGRRDDARSECEVHDAGSEGKLRN